MNIRKSLLLSGVAVSLAAPGFASAGSWWEQVVGESNPTSADHSKSTKTRAEVLQELAVSRQDGTLPINAELIQGTPVNKTALGSGKTRAEVRNELFTMSPEEKKHMDERYFGE